jgi:hypothetical protein
VAIDADGDDVVYSFSKTAACCIIVPQTGEILVLEVPLFPTTLSVVAHERDNRKR